MRKRSSSQYQGHTGSRANRSKSPDPQRPTSMRRRSSSPSNRKMYTEHSDAWVQTARGTLILTPPPPQSSISTIDLKSFHDGGLFQIGRPPSHVIQAAMMMCDTLDKSPTMLAPHQSRWGATRRLVATIASPEVIKEYGGYSFSGRTHRAFDWNGVPGCNIVADWAAMISGHEVSMCHVNKYQANDGKALPGLSEHSDDEKIISKDSRIVCLSLGNAAMRVTFRTTSPRKVMFDHVVTPYTFYVMGGNLQSWSTHEVRPLTKTQSKTWGTNNYTRHPDTRWSLTFRKTRPVAQGV